MIHWHQFILSSVQTVMFTPDHSAFASGRVVSTILREFSDLFCGEMQVLPIPADAPPEIPRVVLKNDDGSQVVSAGPSRFDCVWMKGNDNSMELTQVVGRCAEVLEYYERETRVRVGRLGLVIQRACQNESPAETLIERFCSEASRREPFNRSAAFEIHNHKEYTPDQQGISDAINSWVRCQTGLIQSGQERPQAAIIVTQDMNTLADEMPRRHFRAEEIKDFFSMASREANAIVAKYFPE